MTKNPAKLPEKDLQSTLAHLQNIVQKCRKS